MSRSTNRCRQSLTAGRLRQTLRASQATGRRSTDKMKNDIEFSILVDLLRYRATFEPGKIAFTYLQDGVTEDGSLTYQELDRQARMIAASLRDTTVVGDRALLLYPSGLDFIAAFFGCLYAGVVAVPAYPPKKNQKLSRLKAIISDASPSVVLCTTSIAEDLAAPWIEGTELARMRCLSTDMIADDPASDWHKAAITRDALALLQYTSGSTSAPKGVMVSHGNLLHNSECIRRSFELTPDTVSVTWLPSYHDMGLIDGIIQPVYTGFAAFLMSPGAFLQQPLRWLKAISKYSATHSGGPDFGYALCVDKTTPQEREGLDLSSWSTAYNGAEPIRQATLKEFTAAFEPHGFRPHFFYPCYGLAEVTLMATGGLVNEAPIYCEAQTHHLELHRIAEPSSPADKVSRLVGCGRACINTRVVIADPESLTLCSPDQVGEIWLSGDSVALGYWRQPEKTRETFGAYLADTGEGPFLRTGDLGFLRGDELFLTGRLKDLFIVRGRNHYPQDIELTAEQSHPALRPGCGAAFVVEIEAHEQLVVVHEVKSKYVGKLNVEEVTGDIRHAIAEQHESQAYAIVLIGPGKIPKTSSGKIQRHSCRAEFLAGTLDDIGRSVLRRGDERNVATSLRRADILALSPWERNARLVDYINELIWQVVGMPTTQWDTRQSLLQMGIDSLMAMELLHQLETSFGVVVSLADLLRETSIDALADMVLALLEESSSEVLKPLIAVSAEIVEHPLSQGQQALWFLHQLAPDSAAYSVSFAARILSDLAVDAFRASLQMLCDRHPALRTTFATVDGQPVQLIQQRQDLDFEQVDAADWSQSEIEEFLLEFSHRPFDLQKGPLLRVRLCSRGATEHILLLTAHHIVVDLWSLVLLLDELRLAYSSLTARQVMCLPPLDWQFADYVHWQRELLAGSTGENLWSYWQKQLDGAPATLNISTDKPRTPVQHFRGAAETSRWNEELVGQLRALAKAQGATFYMLLLAAFQVLLHRYTGQEDILVGSSVAGRSRAEFAGVVGYLANQLALRARFSGNPTFQEFLGDVKKTVLEALAHQDYPFALLVKRLHPERDASHSPLFQTMFVLEKAHRLPELASFALGSSGASMDFSGLHLESMVLEQRTSQFDLTLMLIDSPSGLTASWQYNTDLFEQDTIRRMSGHFQTLLQAVVSDPEQVITQLPLLNAAERNQMLVEWNRTQVDYPHDKCIHELFEAQVAKTPHAMAVAYRDERLTYEHLNGRANRVARKLRQMGVGPEAVVGIYMSRSTEMVAGVMGVLKAGGAYLPLDATYPRERVMYMMEDAGAGVVVTQREKERELEGSRAEVLCIEDVWEGEGDQEEGEQSEEEVEKRARGENLAYVIYTSGSTGKPKGVMLDHRGMVNYLSWCVDNYAVADGSGAPVNSSIAFDATITSLFSPLLVGKMVTLIPEPDEITALTEALCSGDGFSLVKITPAHLDLLTSSLLREQGRGHSRRLITARALIVGGEALSASSLTFWRDYAPGTKIINEYGPTETVVGSCVYEVTTETLRYGTVPIGRPIANTEIYLLDGHLQPVPIGVVGELYIGGAGVARGYLNHPELTAEKFICNPFTTELNARLYKTGDRARYLPDGTIEFLGRMDDQVKIRGFRIELGEIESVLLQHPGVREAAAAVHEGEQEDKRLVAYFVRRQESADITTSELRRFLAERLPTYMMPSAFVSLKKLPLTSNGKLDKRSLPQPGNQRPDLEETSVLPVTEMERLIAIIWQEVLHIDDVGTHDNFFELGGHSLLTAQIHDKLQSQLRQNISVIDLLQYPTINSLAKYLTQRQESDPDFQSIHDRARKQKQAMKLQKKLKVKRSERAKQKEHGL
jgi:amino acid adenylation domain-containing protein